MSRLSFIIPVYKTEHILARCIQSLVAQSLTEWEAIFVLDGPSDDARRIIKREMARVKGKIPYKIEEIEHGGACKARNHGFSKSKGEYVIFWDSDCIIEPGASQGWVDEFNADPDVDFIYSGYRFENDQGAINGEEFDPWLLRVRNYISSCFPLRRSLVVPWNESLDSLQDWDFWLSVVEKGGRGRFVPGYAFETETPRPTSISGKGCTPEVWLERVRAVQKLHGIEERKVCVSSLSYKHDAIQLAKSIGADFQDQPNAKPNPYDTFIQIGFSMAPGLADTAVKAFSKKDSKKFLFWTCDNISEMKDKIAFSSIVRFSAVLNETVTQYCEDLAAKRFLDRAGFKVEIMPLPFESKTLPHPMPKKPRFAVDICPEYGHVFVALDKSLPDIELSVLDGASRIEDYTGLIYFFTDHSMSPGIKRTLLAGRHVISNVQSPFAGYVEDDVKPDIFIPEMVDKIRKTAKRGINAAARDFYIKTLSKDKLMEAIRA